MRRAALYALPVATVLLIVCAWFSEELLGIFAHQPGAADIAGTWAFDGATFDSRIERTVIGVPDLNGARDKYRAALQARSAPFHEVVYTFRADGYAVRDAHGEHEMAASYEESPPDMVTVRPQNGEPFPVRIDERGKRLSLVFPGGEVPFTSAQ